MATETVSSRDERWMKATKGAKEYGRDLRTLKKIPSFRALIVRKVMDDGSTLEQIWRPDYLEWCKTDDLGTPPQQANRDDLIGQYLGKKGKGE